MPNRDGCWAGCWIADRLGHTGRKSCVTLSPKSCLKKHNPFGLSLDRAVEINAIHDDDSDESIRNKRTMFPFVAFWLSYTFSPPREGRDKHLGPPLHCLHRILPNSISVTGCWTRHGVSHFLSPTQARVFLPKSLSTVRRTRFRTKFKIYMCGWLFFFFNLEVASLIRLPCKVERKLRKTLSQWRSCWGSPWFPIIFWFTDLLLAMVTASQGQSFDG